MMTVKLPSIVTVRAYRRSVYVISRQEKKNETQLSYVHEASIPFSFQNRIKHAMKKIDEARWPVCGKRRFSLCIMHINSASLSLEKKTQTSSES
jgi:hypothetical protein